MKRRISVVLLLSVLMLALALSAVACKNSGTGDGTATSADTATGTGSAAETDTATEPGRETGTETDTETETATGTSTETETETDPVAYTVQFEVNGETVASVPVLDGNALTAEQFPADPTAEGYTFAGWFAGETKVEAGYTVTGDVTVSARFEKISLTVTFVSGDSSTEVAVPWGEALTAEQIPADPVVEGYTFGGWFAGETKVEAGYTVRENLTVTARLEKVTLTVTFVNGDDRTEVAVLWGDLVDTDKLPSDPEKVAYSFDGWFDGGTAFDEEAPIKASATYTAKFTKTQYIVTFFGGKTPVTVYVDIEGGAALTAAQIPAVPEGEGAFMGWFDGETKAADGLVITADTVFTASFLKADVYAGTWYSVEKLMMVTVNAADGTVAGTGMATSYEQDSVTGALVVKAKGSDRETFTFTLSDDRKSVQVDHFYDEYGDGYIEDYIHEFFTLTKLETTGLAGEYRQDKTTSLSVADNGVITKAGSSAPYFGIVIPDAEGSGLTVYYKSSSYAKLTEFHAVRDEKGNLVLDGEQGIYIAGSDDFTAYYCSATSENLYVFTVGGAKVYVYREAVTGGHRYEYATVTGEAADGAVVTFTAGEKTATVKLEGSYMKYASEEAGSYAMDGQTAVLDGFGRMTVGGTAYSYTVVGDKIKVEGLGVFTLSTADMTLTAAAAIGYAGSYSYRVDYALESRYTLTLDGYGTATFTVSGKEYVGTYTVSDGVLTVSDCYYAVKGAWTLTHDGNAMELTKYGSLYQLVLDGYYPTVDESVFYGYFKNGETVLHVYSEFGYLWLDGFTSVSLRPTLSWDGKALVFEATDECAVTSSKPKTTFLVTLQDGNLLVTHQCADGYDDDGYLEYNAKTVTYAPTEAPAPTFAFGEDVVGTWYKPDGTEVVVTADGITVGGVAGTDYSMDTSWGTNYYFSLNGTQYILYKGYYGDATCIYMGLASSYDAEELLAQKPAAEDDAFAGKWVSGSLVWEFDGKGTVTNENGATYTYKVADGKASFSNGYYDITATLSEDGKLNVHYDDGYGEDVFDKIFTKETAPVEEKDAFAGKWVSGSLVWEFDGKGTVTNENGATYTYKVADGKASFSNGYYDITATLSEDGKLNVHYDDGYGEDVFDKTFTNA